MSYASFSSGGKVWFRSSLKPLSYRAFWQQELLLAGLVNTFNYIS